MKLANANLILVLVLACGLTAAATATTFTSASSWKTTLKAVPPRPSSLSCGTCRMGTRSRSASGASTTPLVPHRRSVFGVTGMTTCPAIPPATAVVPVASRITARVKAGTTPPGSTPWKRATPAWSSRHGPTAQLAIPSGWMICTSSFRIMSMSRFPVAARLQPNLNPGAA